MTETVKTSKRRRRTRAESFTNAWMDTLVYMGDGLLFPIIGIVMFGGIIAFALTFGMLPQVLGVLAAILVCGPLAWALGSDGFLFEALGVGALILGGLALAVVMLGVMGPILLVLSPIVLLAVAWVFLSSLFS